MFPERDSVILEQNLILAEEVEEFHGTLQTYSKLFDILTHMFNICDAVGTCLKPGHINPNRNKLCHRIYFHQFIRKLCPHQDSVHVSFTLCTWTNFQFI
jgi:hypothetical protein